MVDAREPQLDPLVRLLVITPLLIIGGAILIGLVLDASMPAAVAFAILLPVGLIVLTAAVGLVLGLLRWRREHGTHEP